MLVVGPACVLTHATAALSFIALQFSESDLIRTFGEAGLLATLIAMFAVLMLVPLLGVLLQLQRIPSAQTIAHLMTINRNCMTKADAVVIAAIEAGVPSLIEARALVDQFHSMIRKKDEAKLDVWIANAKRSLVSSFATGALKDRAAVRAAIIQPWSNGQVEAQITKLKLLKRQMYGRAKIDLLEARLLGTA
jgi:hypothetical protein